MEPRFGQWETLRQLGAGGQGNVFLVRHPDRVRALGSWRQKLEAEFEKRQAAVRPERASVDDFIRALRPLLDDDPERDLGAAKQLHSVGPDVERSQAHARFRREIEVLSRLEHPGIIRLRDADPDRQWMITEFCAGGTLESPSQRQRFTRRALESMEALRPLVSAVTALHKEGLVHRDIKPGNIFVRGNGTLALGDLGIAADLAGGAERVTETGERVGS